MSNVLEQATDRNETTQGMSLAIGIVSGNVDLISEGKIQVRVPSLGNTFWARLVAIGAGDGAGFFYVPRMNDEVLVGFAGDEPTDAFVLGGLWSLQDRVPVTDPFTALTTRTIKSGVVAGQGQEIELDDLVQAVTITTVTGQKIRLDPDTIELTNLAGTISISMANSSQSISIKSVGTISLEATEIKLKALASVSVEGGVSASFKGTGTASISGGLVTIN